jgi:IS30 family transposase
MAVEVSSSPFINRQPVKPSATPFAEGAAMPKIYTHLTTQERAVMMTMRDDQCSIRAIPKRLGRAPNSISRELRRAPGGVAYDANLVHLQSGVRRVAPRRLPKLHLDSALFQASAQAAQQGRRQARPDQGYAAHHHPTTSRSRTASFRATGKAT